MNIFYTPNIKPTDNQFELDEAESKHAVKVLRLNKEDEVTLVDGKGNYYNGVIKDNHPKRCIVEIKEHLIEKQADFKVHVAIAPTKNNDRMEWFVEKVTELGIDAITFIISHHSERKVIKTERVLKRAIAAMKQSLKATLPQINEPISLEKFLTQEQGKLKYIAYCGPTENKSALKEAYTKGENCVILIGPEGDFSPHEVEQALKYNFRTVSLGNGRLRTETAGIVACHTINLLNE